MTPNSLRVVCSQNNPAARLKSLTQVDPLHDVTRREVSAARPVDLCTDALPGVCAFGQDSMNAASHCLLLAL